MKLTRSVWRFHPVVLCAMDENFFLWQSSCGRNSWLTEGMDSRSSGVTETSFRSWWSWLSPSVWSLKSWKRWRTTMNRNQSHYWSLCIYGSLSCAYCLHGLNQVQVINHETIHTCLNLQQLQPETWEKREWDRMTSVSSAQNTHNTSVNVHSWYLYIQWG